MGADGLEWIEGLPAELDGQRAILRRLVHECESDDRIRWLAIACSLGRGAADSLSDLDLAVGVRDEEFDAALPDVRMVVDRLGELVERYQHQIEGVTTRHERIFAQYADRCQVDLVVFTASESIGGVRDVVVLYDPDERIAVRFDPSALTPELVREWAFGAWCALADLGKYLRRGSVWEALGRLNEARGQAWKLWAAALEVPNPHYGLTSILDFAPDRMPEAMAGSVSDLAPSRQLQSAQALAGQLGQAGDRLPSELRAVLPHAMAHFITADLDALAAQLR
jgi:hypothetical protein